MHVRPNIGHTVALALTIAVDLHVQQPWTALTICALHSQGDAMPRRFLRESTGRSSTHMSWTNTGAALMPDCCLASDAGHLLQFCAVQQGCTEPHDTGLVIWVGCPLLDKFH